MEEEKSEKGFVIKDRRHFDESGSARKEEEPKREAEKVTEARTEPPTPPPEEEPGRTAPEDAPLPEISFSGFIFSLSTTAMYHFGDFPDPVTKQTTRNLAAAKQTIDILTILKAKTAGNLEEEENQLLDDILYELRMRFVKEMTHP